MKITVLHSVRWSWLLLTVPVAFSLACKGGRKPPVGPGPGPTGPRPEAHFLDASGNRITEVFPESRPTILSRISGLLANQLVEMMLLRDGRPVYRDATGNPQPIQATADNQGTIPLTPILYDLGVDPLTGIPGVQDGEYLLRVTGQGVSLLLSLKVRSRSRQPRVPSIWVLRDNAGRFATGSIAEGNPVFAHGINFPPNRRIRLYVVKDRAGWRTGDRLEDVTGTVEEVATNSGGTLSTPVRVWDSAAVLRDGTRDFDLIADVADENGNFDSRFTAGRDAVDADLTTGFTVQSAYRFGERIPLASDEQGRYRDSFETGETITIWVNPPWRPLIPFAMVKKFICLHKENWRQGDSLVDVTGRPEWDLVRFACLNQYRYTVWAPPLTPGDYDPIIDANQNNIYDEGDILGNSFRVEGPRPKRLYLSARWPILDPGGQTPVTATLISERDIPMQNVTISFRVSNAGSSVSPNSATTDSNGQAAVTVQAGPSGGVTLRVEATAATDPPISGFAEITVRAYGGINAIIQ